MKFSSASSRAAVGLTTAPVPMAESARPKYNLPFTRALRCLIPRNNFGQTLKFPPGSADLYNFGPVLAKGESL
jgi:hypothetical protein